MIVLRIFLPFGSILGYPDQLMIAVWICRSENNFIFGGGGGGRLTY